ncbi:MAG: hypothetical protein JXB23_16355, partial [Candidatus Aminicenantes bacterium]|nr:hypothetical protein [Candidatus Aminicenantes bacterium]
MPDETKHLFLYTIGPVQSFIAAARKTQDLWAGSYLLSHLVQAGLSRLNEKAPSSETIFPVDMSHAGPVNMALMPNRFQVCIEGMDEDGIKALGKTLTETIEKEFADIVRFGISRLSEIDEVADFSKRQIKDFLETFWVAVPYSDSADYEGQYAAIESALAGRKNLRLFEQPEPEASLKCSLCGEREAMHPSQISRVSAVKDFWRRTAEKNKENKFSP